MKKKILGVLVSLLIVAMLTTPLVGTAMAGKGQTKLSFKFILVGMYANPVILERGNSTHIDMPFVATGWTAGDAPYDTSYLPLDLYIDDEPIPPELLAYSAMMKVIYNVNGGSVITVIETITITAGDGYGAGTLELQVKGNTNHGNGVGNGDNFIAFGTGAYEGVKIQGRTPGGPEQVGEIEVAPGVILPISKLERVGTVMGWPE